MNIYTTNPNTEILRGHINLIIFKNKFQTNKMDFEDPLKLKS